MDQLQTIGIIGSVSSIAGLLIKAPDWKARVVHALYGFFIAALASGLVYYKVSLDKLTKIERQARQLLQSSEDIRTDGERRGFILSTLAFLEKHEQRFPVTFKLANEAAYSLGVTKSDEEDSVKRLYQEWRLEDGADTMRYLLKGLASNLRAELNLGVWDQGKLMNVFWGQMLALLAFFFFPMTQYLILKWSVSRDGLPELWYLPAYGFRLVIRNLPRQKISRTLNTIVF